MKYIVVTGGVMSGLGKGITIASIGRNHKNKGYKVTAIKIDPYINRCRHHEPLPAREIFVLKDGVRLTWILGITSVSLIRNLQGIITLLQARFTRSNFQEERGGLSRKNCPIIPHVTNEIKSRIRKVAARSGADICLIEIGGTVGDIEACLSLRLYARCTGKSLPKILCLFM